MTPDDKADRTLGMSLNVTTVNMVQFSAEMFPTSDMQPSASLPVIQEQMLAFDDLPDARNCDAVDPGGNWLVISCRE